MMEALFLGGLVLLVLLGPWVLIARGSFKRKRERREDQERWRDAVARIYELELALQALRMQPPVMNTGRAEPEQSKGSVAQVSVTPVAASISPLPSTAESTASVSAAEAWVTKQAAPVVISESSSVAELSASVGDLSAPPAAPVPPPAHKPAFRVASEAASLADQVKSSHNLEETLGTNWLNKLGIVILVLGVAFFLAYELKTLGPAGKILVGFATSAVLLGAGIWFERKDVYRILARAGIGGGWALLFFTTYAMYHVPAAKVLSSQVSDLVLMLGVAAVMVAHTLRYRSQVVTGLAFLLAYLTVTVSHSNVYSLSAGAVLAMGLVVIVGRMHWFELEAVAILASYFNHYLWLRPIIEPMHGKHHPFPEFFASAGILGLYWLIFRVSYVFRQPSDKRQERVSSVAALLNPALLLLVLKYQSIHKEWAFWALLAGGAIETLLGQLPVTRRRRNAVIVLSTIGVVMLIAAFPFRYSGERLAVLWLMDAEALLLIGVWTKEVVFRRLGMMALVPTSIQMIAVEAARIYGRRMDDADLRADFGLAIVFLVATAVFYANAHWIARRWEDLFTTEFDRRFLSRLSYAGAVMILITAWIAFPEAWTSVVGAALGVGLTIAGRRLAIAELAYQAIFLAVASLIRIFAINLAATGKYHGVTLRLLTILLVSGLLYVTTRWNWATTSGITIRQRAYTFEQLAFAGYTWPASFLISLVAWYELRPVSVADVWAVAGMVLLELGLARNKLSLRLQGYTALVAVFLRIFFVNLNAAGGPGEVSPRFYTVVPLAFAFFYAYWRLYERRDDLLELERRIRAADLCCWLGTVTIASLMRFELEADWVAGAWAALVFALTALAWRSGRRTFLHQGLLIAAGVLFRTILHNFYERSYFPAPGRESRWITVGVTVALLLASLPFAFRLRRQGVLSEKTTVVRLLQSIVWRPEQIVFFIAIGLLTVLLAEEMRYGMVTLSWGIEGVAVFLLALQLGERSFRLTGLGLLLLCVGKIVLVDVWRLNPQDRYITFIVLGVALLLVSFLYTRNREALRQYL
jgi:uncharacterized membrane protein